jgi:hypothetical protein
MQRSVLGQNDVQRDFVTDVMSSCKVKDNTTDVDTRQILDMMLCAYRMIREFDNNQTPTIRNPFWVYTQKYSTIASGATTIGSTERAPDNIIIKYFELEIISGHNIFEPILEKEFFDYSLGGYSHRERWACTWRCFIMNIGAKKVKEDSGTIISPIGSEFLLIKVK